MEFLKGKLLFLFLFVSPFLAFILSASLGTFASLKLIPEDPNRVKMATLVEDHFAGKTHAQIDVFNDRLYLVKNPIEKGKQISAKDVESCDFKLNSPHKGVHLFKEEVIGSTATRLLSPGQLVDSSDLRAPKNSIVAADSKALGDFDARGLTFALTAILVALSPVLILIAAYVWILIVAFKTSTGDGISCLILSPFAIPLFTMRNWERALRPFQLYVIACSLIGLSVAFMVSGAAKEKSVMMACQLGEAEAHAEIKSPVVYTLKNLREGQLISADAVTLKQIQIDKVPQDAISDPARAIGKKVKYGMSPNQIVSAYDLK